MYLSTCTVNSRLPHVFAKLGIRFRVGLARLAAERGTPLIRVMPVGRHGPVEEGGSASVSGGASMNHTSFTARATTLSTGDAWVSWSSAQRWRLTSSGTWGACEGVETCGVAACGDGHAASATSRAG
ncbi:MAG: hypothetical protein ACRDOU_23660 [Streptosporangiaceae bacterium]